ncbi:uncharacterized protein BDW43DRAFT_258861 [Aspergillus alliaceus]|uniref:uncharacterized protein n=1 Tax=Petromyces alliaceus TaxID=209559 RepID=UPI0012A65666|nr:uncharacterized protein BDW43DRAFT_258861 [Aspergillus alliaceus]KAB8239676.1 hypothetical protein BDW43DRAFT_258861 [Aspergillus alliaceus]
MTPEWFRSLDRLCLDDGVLHNDRLLSINYIPTYRSSTFKINDLTNFFVLWRTFLDRLRRL